MAKKPWHERFMNEKFEFSTANTAESLAFCREAQSWFRKFCKDNGFTDLEFHQMHFEFSGFFKVGDQWWYFSSGDIRFKICNWMLIRTAKSNKDYTGGMNQQVKYGLSAFEQNLLRIVAPHLIGAQPE